MKEYKDISKITMSVIVNHTDRTTTVKRSGVKTPLSFVQCANAAAYRAALRDAAFYLLDLASETDGANPVRDQIRIMWDEHRPFNLESLN